MNSNTSLVRAFVSGNLADGKATIYPCYAKEGDTAYVEAEAKSAGLMPPYAIFWPDNPCYKVMAGAYSGVHHEQAISKMELDRVIGDAGNSIYFVGDKAGSGRLFRVSSGLEAMQAYQAYTGNKAETYYRVAELFVDAKTQANTPYMQSTVAQLMASGWAIVSVSPETLRGACPKAFTEEMYNWVEESVQQAIEAQYEQDQDEGEDAA